MEASKLPLLSPTATSHTPFPPPNPNSSQVVDVTTTYTTDHEGVLRRRRVTPDDLTHLLSLASHVLATNNHTALAHLANYTLSSRRP